MMRAMQADVSATPEALQRLVDEEIRAMKSILGTEDTYFMYSGILYRIRRERRWQNR
jgi:hypothetical protein